VIFGGCDGKSTPSSPQTERKSRFALGKKMVGKSRTPQAK
jgi:hypothetical protein